MSVLTAIALAGATGFAGLQLGAEAGDVAAVLARRCERVETVAVAPPRTPLANQTEVHMRCFGVLGEGRVADADFLMADGRLRLIELRGPAVAGWVGAHAGGESLARGAYASFRDAGIVLQEAERRAWLMDGESFRSFAFLQEDPFESEFEQETPAPPVLPPELELGGRFDEIAGDFSRACRSHVIRELPAADHPLEPGKHVQVDCYGYRFLGFPRLIEAVFADGTLTHVRIPTTAQEETRHRAALVAHYGAATRGGEAFEVYGDGTVVLRKQGHPAILFMTTQMADVVVADGQGRGG